MTHIIINNEPLNLRNKRRNHMELVILQSDRNQTNKYKYLLTYSHNLTLIGLTLLEYQHVC